MQEDLSEGLYGGDQTVQILQGVELSEILPYTGLRQGGSSW